MGVRCLCDKRTLSTALGVSLLAALVVLVGHVHVAAAQSGQVWQVYANGVVVMPNGTSVNTSNPLGLAVSNAAPGSTIVVHSGVYNQYVDIDKTLTIVGVGMPALENIVYESNISLTFIGVNLTYGFTTSTGSIVDLVLKDSVLLRGAYIYSLYGNITIYNSTVYVVSHDAIVINYLKSSSVLNITDSKIETVSRYGSTPYAVDIYFWSAPISIYVYNSNVTSYGFVGLSNVTRLDIVNSTIIGEYEYAFIMNSLGDLSVVNSNITCEGYAFHTSALLGNVTIVRGHISASDPVLDVGKLLAESSVNISDSVLSSGMYSLVINIKGWEAPMSVYIYNSSLSSGYTLYLGEVTSLTILDSKLSASQGDAVDVLQALGDVTIVDSKVSGAGYDFDIGQLFGNITIIDSSVSGGLTAFHVNSVNASVTLKIINSSISGDSYAFRVVSWTSPIALYIYHTGIQSFTGLYLGSVSSLTIVDSNLRIQTRNLINASQLLGNVTIVNSQLFGVYDALELGALGTKSVLNITGSFIDTGLYAVNFTSWRAPVTVYVYSSFVEAGYLAGLGNVSTVTVVNSTISTDGGATFDISYLYGNVTIYNSSISGRPGFLNVSRTPGEPLWLNITKSQVNGSAAFNGDLVLYVDDSYLGSWSGPWLQTAGGQVLFPGGGDVIEASSLRAAKLVFLDTPGGYPMHYVDYTKGYGTASLGPVSAVVAPIDSAPMGNISIIEFSNAPFGCPTPEGSEVFAVVAALPPNYSAGVLNVTVSGAKFKYLLGVPQTCWVNATKASVLSVELHNSKEVVGLMIAQTTASTTTTTSTSTTTTTVTTSRITTTSTTTTSVKTTSTSTTTTISTTSSTSITSSSTKPPSHVSGTLIAAAVIAVIVVVAAAALLLLRRGAAH